MYCTIINAVEHISTFLKNWLEKEGDTDLLNLFYLTDLNSHEANKLIIVRLNITIK